MIHIVLCIVENLIFPASKFISKFMNFASDKKFTRDYSSMLEFLHPNILPQRMYCFQQKVKLYYEKYTLSIQRNQFIWGKKKRNQFIITINKLSKHLKFTLQPMGKIVFSNNNISSLVTNLVAEKNYLPRYIICNTLFLNFLSVHLPSWNGFLKI